MKIYKLSGIAIGMFSLGAAAFGDVTGVWVTEPNEETGASGFVEIKPCGEFMCGTLVGNTAGTSTHTGKKIVWDMRKTSDTNWDEGKIMDPVKEKTYNSYMTLEGDKLRVHGCIAFICRGQTWTRKK